MLPGYRFTHRNRVRYAEVDPQGVVFNARYLDYADLGITEYFRAIREAGLWPAGADPQFHVRHATVDFRAPLIVDEAYEVGVRTAATGRTSTTTEFAICGLAGGEDLRCLVTIVAVHVDLSDHRPRPLPDWYAGMLEAFDARP